jgi:predicted nucleotidyltransferase
MTTASTVIDLPPAPPHLANDPVLRRIRKGLADLFGTRLAGVVLYGSRARGDNHPDSDFDLLVLLEGPIDREHERWRLAELATDIGLETNELPSFLLDTPDALSRRTIFMHTVREDGLVL